MKSKPNPILHMICETTQYSFVSFVSKTTIFAKLLDLVSLVKPLWDLILQAKH